MATPLATELTPTVPAGAAAAAPAKAPSTAPRPDGILSPFDGDLLPDRVAPSSVTIVDDSCVVLVSIPVAP